MFRIFRALGILTLAASSQCFAQRLWTIDLAGPTGVEGVVLDSLRNDTLFVSYDRTGLALPIMQIERMSSEGPSLGGFGLAGGLMAGTIVGGAIYDEEQVSHSHMPTALSYALIGALAGGLVLAFIDTDVDIDLRALSLTERGVRIEEFFNE